MRVWGGLLPFIGFRSITKTEDPELWRFAQLPDDMTEVTAFEMEWFGYGLTFIKRKE